MDRNEQINFWLGMAAITFFVAWVIGMFVLAFIL